MTTGNEKDRVDSGGKAGAGAGHGGAADGFGPETPVTYCFLSELLNAQVRYEDEPRPFGRLYDLGVRDSPTPYPVVASLQVKSGKRGISVVPWSAVSKFSLRELVVRRDPVEAPEVRFWIRRDVLDDQVVDISGAKARRVNDVHLLEAEGKLIVAHVAVGFRSVLRRLGVERPALFLLQWLLDYKLRDNFVSWKNVEVLSIGGPAGELRFSGSSQLAQMHPAEVADILEKLGQQERQTLFNRLPVEAAADALEEMDPEMQRVLISQQKPEKAAEILEEMPSREMAAVLRDLQQSEAQEIIGEMGTKAARDIRTVLAHRGKSAGGSMETACIEAGPRQRADEVEQHVRSRAEKVGVYSYVYVLDAERHLLGVATLRKVLAAAPDTPLESLMTTHVVKVPPDTSLADLARLFGRYGFRAIPVVDEHNVFLGAVRLRSVLAKLSPLFRK